MASIKILLYSPLGPRFLDQARYYKHIDPQYQQCANQREIFKEKDFNHHVPLGDVILFSYRKIFQMLRKSGVQCSGQIYLQIIMVIRAARPVILMRKTPITPRHLDLRFAPISATLH